MTLRCKVGYLAVVVGKRYPGDGWQIGHVARCIEMASHSLTGEPAWVIEPPLVAPYGQVHDCILDAMLRPIRPQPDSAVDEMLLIAGKPTEVTA